MCIRDSSSIILTKHVPEEIEAPVKKGQKIGTATLSYAGQNLATVDLVAAESVERSELLHSADTVKAVSYTHLEVYKRQEPLCPIWYGVNRRFQQGNHHAQGSSDSWRLCF